MNFDWTGAEKEMKEKVSGVFGADSLSDLETMECADLARIKEITLDHLGRLSEVGFLTVGVGQQGKSEMPQLIAGQEEIAARSGALCIAIESSARLFNGLVSRFAHTDRASDVARKTEKGQLIGAVAMSESENGPVPDQSLTWAEPNDGHFLVSGNKSFVTNGPIADWFAVSADVGGGQAFFLIDADQDGVEPGPRMDTMGYKGLAVSSLALDKVPVPDSLVLGPFEDEDDLTFLNVTHDMILTVASVGLIQRVIGATKNHAQSHQRGGKPIFHYQEVRFKFADMLTLYQASQLLMYRAGWLYSVDDREASTVLHCAKVFTAEASEQVAAMAMQIMAGRGYMAENPVERGFRDAKFAAMAGTTSERARMAIAADLLQKYKV